MDAGVKCPLCGLSADSLPRRPRDEQGVSCKRCGDFYIDGMLTYKSPLSGYQGTAILSGYARWARILGKGPVEINTGNIDEIIEGHRQLTQYDKADLLLRFFSIKEPTPGHFINFDIKLDLPIIYSADDNEFSYLISDFAEHELGYLEYVARSTVKITPSGWKRINWINRVDLASEKFELISANIDAEKNLKIDNAKEKAGLDGTRYSSSLARQIGFIILESAKLKLETKLKIDKEVIFGTEVMSDPDSASLLSDRIKSFWEKEKEVVQNILKKNYEECHGMSYYEFAKERFLGEVEKAIRLLQIDLKAGESSRKEELAEEKKVSEKNEAPDPKRVFVVYGRNEKARKALFDLLRTVGLNPYEWSELVKKTKKGAPYVGEILDVAFNEAQAVIVLLTGDDIAYLREEYIKPNDADHEGRPSPQARANVLFEAGRALGTFPDRTILVELDNERTKPFSDISGRHFLRLSNQVEKRKELVERLGTAGCDVCIDGTDWMSAGDFDGAAFGWPSSTPEQTNQIRGKRKTQRPAFDIELGTANITGFSKKQVWASALKVLKAEQIEVLKTSESWIFARETTGDKVEVDIGIVDHPGRDELRPWAPAVSIGIDVPKIGELGDNQTWTPEQRRALSHHLYEKIIDVLYQA
jgi:predicted nucleotide-binding protein